MGEWSKKNISSFSLDAKTPQIFITTFCVCYFFFCETFYHNTLKLYNASDWHIFPLQVIDTNSLSWSTRVKGFAICFVLGFLFSLLGSALFFLPKGTILFAIFYTLGNVMAISRWAVLNVIYIYSISWKPSFCIFCNDNV